MKQILLALFLSLFIAYGHSQTFTLTQSSNEPVIGDVYTSFLLDTSAYASGLNVANTGSNTVWTYTDLVTTSNTTSSTYMDPSSVASSSNYPGCTIVQKTGPLYSYYKSVNSPSTQLEFIGISSSSLNMTFTNTALYARYPFSYSDVATDNFSGSCTYSFSGSASGNATITADGTGTLNLPNDTLTDVLRVKSYQSTTFSSGGFPIGSIKMTNYDFYHSGQKFPVFNIQYQTMTITGQTPTVTALARGNQNNFVMGLNELETRSALAITIYPNPAGNVICFYSGTDKIDADITIYNQILQKIYCGPIQEQLNISHLQSGVYIVEVKNQRGVLRKKIVKE